MSSVAATAGNGQHIDNRAPATRRAPMPDSCNSCGCHRAGRKNNLARRGDGPSATSTRRRTERDRRAGAALVFEIQPLDLGVRDTANCCGHGSDAGSGGRVAAYSALLINLK